MEEKFNTPFGINYNVTYAFDVWYKNLSKAHLKDLQKNRGTEYWNGVHVEYCIALMKIGWIPMAVTIMDVNQPIADIPASTLIQKFTKNLILMHKYSGEMHILPIATRSDYHLFSSNDGFMEIRSFIAWWERESNIRDMKAAQKLKTTFKVSNVARLFDCPTYINLPHFSNEELEEIAKADAEKIAEQDAKASIVDTNPRFPSKASEESKVEKSDNEEPEEKITESKTDELALDNQMPEEKDKKAIIQEAIKRNKGKSLFSISKLTKTAMIAYCTSYQLLHEAKLRNAASEEIEKLKEELEENQRSMILFMQLTCPAYKDPEFNLFDGVDPEAVADQMKTDLIIMKKAAVGDQNLFENLIKRYGRLLAD